MEASSVTGDCHGSRHAEHGFTYIGILIAVALLGISLAAVGTIWSVTAKREKEAELLYIGHQFREAIARYNVAGGAGVQLPRDLDDLVEDHRALGKRRFLRKIYRDPMTGAADWELIRGKDGGIIGVASTSLAKPIKQANFDPLDTGFEGADCYCKWRFEFDRQQPMPATGGALNGAGHSPGSAQDPPHSH